MLLYFILGGLFIFVGVPLLQNLVSIVSTLTEYVVYIFALKISLIKKKIEENGSSSEEQEEEDNELKIGFQSTNCVGSEIQVIEEED